MTTGLSNSYKNCYSKLGRLLDGQIGFIPHLKNYGAPWWLSQLSIRPLTLAQVMISGL